MASLTLQNIASMSYADFQKTIDEEGSISPLQWFKNANVFYGLQGEARNVIYERETEDVLR